MFYVFIHHTESNPNHTKAGVFTCEECPKTFHDPRNMKNHIRTCHLKIKPFKCNLCDKEYVKQQNLWEHSFVHTDGILPYHCPAEDCGLKTKSRGFFREHLLRKHKIIYDEAVHGYTGMETTRKILQRNSNCRVVVKFKFFIRRLQKTTKNW
jgi:NAD-dependent SIR2 family protein deacetylase